MDNTNERSVASDGSVAGEPVAWAVVLNAIAAISMNGGATYRVTANKEEADRIAAHAMAVVPLYERQPPTLSDAERRAVVAAAELAEETVEELDDGDCQASALHYAQIAATLRGLLERLGVTESMTKEKRA